LTVADLGTLSKARFWDTFADTQATTSGENWSVLTERRS